jgi:hypothetical protein
LVGHLAALLARHAPATVKVHNSEYLPEYLRMNGVCSVYSAYHTYN